MYTINLRKKVIYPQCGGITLDSDIVEFSSGYLWLDIKYIVKKPSVAYQRFILLLLYEISVSPVSVYP